jgi:chromosome segregation ATPase
MPAPPPIEQALEAPLSGPPSLAPDLTPDLSPDDSDDVMQVQMPYLMRGGQAPARPASVSLAKAVPEAVVPGGAAHAPDLETMREYLVLREQDVAALSSQLKSARDQIGGLERDLAVERGRVGELEHTVKEQRKQIDEFEREKAIAMEGLTAELSEMKFQMKARTDRVKVLEGQVKEANLEMERLKERVRMDLRKIRVREKELESRLEVMKKDSEALIGARETRIIELKRKLDLLEFNMDLLQDQYQREKDNTEQLRERLAKAAQVVNVAGGLLDTRERKVS